MNAKGKPQQENRTHQNSKKFKSFNRVGFPNLNENRNSFLDGADFGFAKSKSELEDSDNVSDVEDDSPKRNKSRRECSTVTTKKKKRHLYEVPNSDVATKSRHRKDPLPMKFRAFPQSFWQQPNKTPSVSPGTVYCAPSPLSKEEDSPENRGTLEEALLRTHQEVVSKPNIDLLFSLFRNVEEEQRKALGQRNAPLVRRGRPKKTKTESKVIRDDDPYLTSSAAESFLPLLPLRSSMESLQYKIAKDEQILAMVSIDGSSSTMLTSVNSANQNYSQILSELVVQL